MAHILLYMATFQTILSKLYMAHFLAATTEPLSILSLLVCSRPTQAPFLASVVVLMPWWSCCRSLRSISGFVGCRSRGGIGCGCRVAVAGAAYPKRTRLA